MRAGAAAGVSAVLIASLTPGAAQALPTWTVPGPELEQAWEAGSAGTVYDGDTLLVGITSSSSAYTGTQKVRTIGINAPEVAHDSQAEQCGAAQAKTALRQLAPKGTPLQLRALFDTSYDDKRGRVVRSIYAQDSEGNWFDTARQLVSDGRALWFPHKPTLADNPEWAHNLEYRVLADDAKAGRRGLWSAGYCGSSPSANLRMSVSWDQAVDGHEKVFIFNDATSSTSLAGWTMRDSALNLYRFPGNAFVPARGSIEVRFRNGVNDPAAGIYYTSDRNWFDNLPADNPHFAGDSVYLMDNAGSYETGNMRAWFPYPCNPDECRDPLRGALSVGKPTFDNAEVVPSAPRQVDVASGTDGSLDVIWQEPTSVGDAAGITGYRVVATPVGGDALAPKVVDESQLSTNLDGLTAGSAYNVTVAARNEEGWSEASAPTGPVTARTAPEPPTVAEVTPLAEALWVSWDAPDDNGSTISSYTATATPTSGAGGFVACTTTGTELSCVIPGLSSAEEYTVAVTATNGAGTSADSDPSAAVQPLDPSSTDPTPAPVTDTAPADDRSYSATGVPTPTPPAWTPTARETITIRNTSGARADLTGYGLWNKDPRVGTNGTIDTPDYVFPRGTTVPAGATLSVRSGDPTAIEPSSATMHYTGRGPLFTPAADLAELSNMNKAMVDCAAWGGVTCRGQRPTSISTPPVGITARISGRNLTVNWGAPISRGGKAITRYSATAFDSPNGGNPIGSCSAGGNARSCTIGGLAPGGTFYAEVVAQNAVGVSAPSAPRVQGKPRTAPAAPGSVAVSGGSGSVNVTWSAAAPNGAAVTTYTASAYTTATGGSPSSQCSTTGALTCTLPGLKQGTPYFVDVTATNRVGTGAASSPRASSTPEGAPTALSTYSKRKVTVRWDPPAPGPSAITGYSARVYAKKSGGKKLGSCTAPAGATKCRTKKLKRKPKSKYYIALTTEAGVGSFTVNPRIVTGPPRKASKPKGASATSSGRRVAISWSPPSFTGYTWLTKSRARLFTKKKKGKVAATCYTGPNNLTCTTKKVKKRKYYAAAQVKNKKGWSKWSTRVKVVVR
jgi:endonuclease YncB( thermonuclease family)